MVTQACEADHESMTDRIILVGIGQRALPTVQLWTAADGMIDLMIDCLPRCCLLSVPKRERPQERRPC